MSHEVDLVINCYERTYRQVLTAERFAAAVADNVRPFARRTALVNNVDDRADAQRRADALIEAGALDAVFFVEDHLDEALARTGLRREELQPIQYFTDWALVAVCLPGPDWMLHWDAEVRLRAPMDWITPSIELMERDPRVLITNPNWPPPTIVRNALELTGPFALGHGCSDQVLLGRRSELARPIYGDRTLARVRYPVAHLGDIFEARLDSHMRRRGRLRATHLEAIYEHPVTMGLAYPRRSLRETARYARNRLAFRVLDVSPRALRPFTLKSL